MQLNTWTHTHEYTTHRCRRNVGNGGDLCGEGEKRYKRKAGSVATDDPDNVQNSKEVGREAQGTQGLLSKKRTRREKCVPFVASDQRLS